MALFSTVIGCNIVIQKAISMTGSRKLPDTEVIEIFYEYEFRGENQYSLEKKWPVSQATIGRYCNAAVKIITDEVRAFERKSGCKITSSIIDDA